MTYIPLSGIASAFPIGEGGPRSGGTFLAPHRGSCPKGEARRYVANDFLNLIAFPSRGRLAIREYRFLKRRRATLVNPSAPPLRHPERSRGIFLARPPYARMRPTQTTPWCFPLSPFPHSRFTGLPKGSLHFGPHDTQERRIVSHPFSYRCVELCLSEALYPAPSARAVWPHRKAP